MTGGACRLERPGDSLPDTRRVSRTANAQGGNWMGLRERGADAVRSSTSLLLLPGLLVAFAMAAVLLLAWRREGR